MKIAEADSGLVRHDIRCRGAKDYLNHEQNHLIDVPLLVWRISAIFEYIQKFCEISTRYQHRNEIFIEPTNSFCTSSIK